MRSRTCGTGVDHLLGATEELAAALANMEGEQHHAVKDLRRILDNQPMPPANIVLRLKFMVDHDDGLLNAVESDLIQTAYDINRDEETRLSFIRTLNATIEFSKALALTHASTLEF